MEAKHINITHALNRDDSYLPQEYLYFFEQLTPSLKYYKDNETLALFFSLIGGERNNITDTYRH
jgi:hypothetical protein